MSITPYSFKEAQNICDEYQYLSGTSFAPATNAPIQCIAITPFDQESKGRFIGFYFLLNDAKQALDFSYSGMLFDVMVIACSPEQTLLHESFQTWIAKKDLATIPAGHKERNNIPVTA